MQEVQQKTIKVQNLTEHLSILKKELQQVNEDLSSKLTYRDSLNDEISALENSKIEKGDELSELLGRIAFFDRSLYSRMDDIKRLNAEIDALTKNIHAHSVELDNVLTSRKMSEEEFKEVTVQLAAKRAEQQNMLDEIKGRVDKTAEELRLLQEAKDHTDRAIKTKENELESIDSTVSEAKRNMVLEMLELRDMIEQEIERVDQPRATIIKHAKEQLEKERRFNIIFSRFKRVFEKQYPGITLKI